MISEKEKSRNYGIELLRTMAMFAIVLQHCIMRSGMADAQTVLSAENGITFFILFFCYGAVDMYLLVSGYVNAKSKYKLFRIMFLWIEVVFYNIVITAVSKLVLRSPITAGEALGVFTPFIHHEYWFFTRYVILFALMPLLNRLANKLPRKWYQALLSVILVLFCIAAPIVKKYTDVDIFVLKNGYSAVWFAAMYLTGAYFRIHEREGKPRVIVCVLLFVLFSTLAYVDGWGVAAVSLRRFGTAYSSGLSSYPYISPFVVAAVICLFLALKNVSPKGAVLRFAKAAGPLTFGVYLIHDNPISREYIVFRLGKRLNEFFGASVSSLLIIILFAAAIFAASLLIEFVTQKLFRVLKIKEACQKFTDFVGEKIFKKIKPIYSLYFGS